MTLGFIGTGTLAAAMVEGLGGGDILLSPRGATIASDLAARFPGVTIAASNQAVVDGSDMVILSIRPEVAEDVVRGLGFRPGQKILSLVAATQIDSIRDWIGFDLPIIRAIPLPFVATRQCVTPIHPPDAEVAALFNRLGTAVDCRTLDEFDLFGVASALMATYFGVLDTAHGWLVRQGLSPQVSRTYLAGLFANLGRVATSSSSDFATLLEEHSTKGGLNEQVFQDFVAQNGAAALTDALDRVLTRVRG
jgi:pyrroline-5-carboxylate reductase